MDDQGKLANIGSASRNTPEQPWAINSQNEAPSVRASGAPSRRATVRG